MGNVLEHASRVAIEDADVIEEDLKWLAVSRVQQSTSTHLPYACERPSRPRHAGSRSANIEAKVMDVHT